MMLLCFFLIGCDGEIGGSCLKPYVSVCRFVKRGNSGLFGELVGLNYERLFLVF